MNKASIIFGKKDLSWDKVLFLGKEYSSEKIQQKIETHFESGVIIPQNKSSKKLEYKPDWSRIYKIFNYVAIDFNGEIWAYCLRPEISKDGIVWAMDQEETHCDLLEGLKVEITNPQEMFFQRPE